MNTLMKTTSKTHQSSNAPLKTALLLLLGVLCQSGLPQANAAVAVDWSVIAGGGGTCTGDRFQLSATVGQPVAGASIAANGTLTVGFWAGAVTLPPPAA